VLFERVKRRVRLTAAARILLDNAWRTLAEADRSRNS